MGNLKKVFDLLLLFFEPVASLNFYCSRPTRICTQWAGITGDSRIVGFTENSGGEQVKIEPAAFSEHSHLRLPGRTC